MTTPKHEVECESGFRQRGESSLKVQWWQVILLFIAALSFIFVTLISHESRITKTETSQEYIAKSIEEIKVTTNAINQKLGQHMENNGSGKR